MNGAPGEKRRAAAGGRWRHGAFSAAAAFAMLCERRLAKAKCGKVDLFQPEVACRARQVESLRLHHVVASFVSLATTFYALLQKSSRVHAAAPPFQIEPASLGSDLVFSGMGFFS